MSSCSPCAVMHTTGPGRLKSSLWTPPMEKRRSVMALVATAAQPWPRHSTFTSSPFGRSTIHSLLVSHEEKWRHCSLLGTQQLSERFYRNAELKKAEAQEAHLASSSVLGQASSTASWDRSATV